MTTEEDAEDDKGKGNVGDPHAGNPTPDPEDEGRATLDEGERIRLEKRLDAAALANTDSLGLRQETALAALASTELTHDAEDEEDEEGDDVPAQLGAQRFVYAAYFAGGIAIAFLLSKAIAYAWARLALWKPQVGEPNEEICIPIAALIGAFVAFYYYRDQKTRTLAEEVASELGKVSWPTRDEVVNSTFVVIVTTVIATAFFALMDRFWGFVTNLVYGA